MSNIYIQEPPTHGKVLLTTSVGDIDIELWSKEAPKACRNFIQLLMEGYYDGTIFHRVVKDFIVQGGDPTGTGEGGESIYGAPFKDEIHTRLRFVRRGLVAMANAGPNDNGSQFFFTFGAAPELNKKHTIFGKVVGNTLFNMLKLEEVETDGNERPLFPPKILKGEILSNPFDDIIPRTLKKKKIDGEELKKPKSKSKATKNFNLLSFGEEAEEDEEQTNKASKTMRGKSKSSHDLIDDPRLSSTPAVETEGKQDGKQDGKQEGKKRKSSGETEGSDTGSDSKEKVMESVKKKLKKEEPDRKQDREKDDRRREDRKREDSDREDRKKDERKREDSEREERRKEDRKMEDSDREERRRDEKKHGDSDREDRRKDDRKKEDSDREDKRKEERKREDSEKVEKKKDERDGEKSKSTKSDDLRKESRKSQRELADAKRKTDKKMDDKKEDKQDNAKDSKKDSKTERTSREDSKKEAEPVMMPKVDMLEEYKQERQKYKELRQKQGKKGSSREAETLAMLAKFQNKLQSVRKIAGAYEEEEEEMEEEKEEETADDSTDMSWLSHKLHFDDKSRKVMDANVHDVDRYEIYDPRNPLTQRRREASKKSSRDRR